MINHSKIQCKKTSRTRKIIKRISKHQRDSKSQETNKIRKEKN